MSTSNCFLSSERARCWPALVLLLCVASGPSAGWCAEPSMAMPVPEAATGAEEAGEALAEQDRPEVPEPAASESAPSQLADSESPAAGPAATELGRGARQYLEGFDLTGRRDPFSEMAHGATPNQDGSWWDRAGESRMREVRFDGSGQHITGASMERLPRIKVTGLMQVGSRRAVCARIQDKKTSVLHENDRIVLDGTGNTKLSKWLVIKRIDRNGMTVILDDGLEITGKFY